MKETYLAPAVMLSVPLETLLHQVHGFFSETFPGHGCPHADLDGDCDGPNGELHEHGR